MTESEMRESLAPRIARKILSRHRANQLTDDMALQLAHEIIATVQGAVLAAYSGEGLDDAGAAIGAAPDDGGLS